MAVSGVGGYSFSASQTSLYGGVGGVRPTGRQTSASADTTGSQALPAKLQAQVDALKQRDVEVKAHEHAHQAAAGGYAGSASYTYQRGPDGQNYAVGGEVPIDASSVHGDPAATAAKMRVVERAALAPAQPSSQDLHVAAQAATELLQAQTQAQSQTQSGQAQAATNFAAQSIGAAAGTTHQGGASGLTRGLAAYATAAGLGANTNQPPAVPISA